MSHGGLGESSHWLRAMFDACLDAVILMDVHGRVVEWNSTAEQLFGYARKDALGALLSELVIPNRLRAKHEAGLREFRHSGRGPILNKRLEMVATSRDDVDIPVELTVTPLHLDGSELFAGFVRDLRPQKQLEGRLAMAQRLELVGRLTSGVAHDFNNALTVVMTYLDLLDSSSGPGPGERVDAELALSEMMDAVVSAADTAKQILAFGRTQKSAPDVPVIDLANVVPDAVALVERLLPARISLSLDVSVPDLRAQVEPIHVTQIITNLVLNSRDAIAGAGEILVGMSRSTDEEVGEISILDTGEGMSAEVRAKIFDPFFSTKPEGVGVGMGLASVHEIVSAYGGTVLVDSSVGKGTLITVRLPLSHSNGQRSPRPLSRRDLSPREGTGATLLVCEDEAPVARALARVLSTHGYRVRTCGEPREALSILEADTESMAVDLLITDVALPGMNGVELARQALRFRPNLPVILMSGYTKGIVLGRETSDIRFLEKPFSTPTLLSAVSDALQASASSPPAASS
ncbi:MAG: ATP-binding protein [Sandaracinaceae bacterium]